MTDTLVSFAAAILAKEKGFNEPCSHRYNVGATSELNDLLAPTQSLLQRWLREKHNIFASHEQ